MFGYVSIKQINNPHLTNTFAEMFDSEKREQTKRDAHLVINNFVW